jgi:hypothetical protein
LDFASKYGGGLFSSLKNDLVLSDRTLVEIGGKIYQLRFSPFQITLLPRFYEELRGEMEAQAPSGTVRMRKAAGMYYTPSYLADYLTWEVMKPELAAVQKMLNQALEEKDSLLFLRGLKRLKKLKILDPACGTGVFLLSAFSQYLNFYQTKLKPLIDKGFSQFYLEAAEIKTDPVSFLEQLFGVDLDVLALEIGKHALFIFLCSRLGLVPSFPLLTFINLKEGNSLFCPPLEGGQSPEKIFFNQEDNLFIWEQEFPQLFKGGEDECLLILGNPPWGGDLSKWNEFIFRRYGKDCQAPFDSYKLFIRLSLELMKKGDRLGFLVPSTLLNQTGYRDIRKKLLEEGSFLTIVDLGEGVFAQVTAPCCLFVWQKGGISREVKLVNLAKINNEEKRREFLADSEQYSVLINQERFFSFPNLTIAASFNSELEDLFLHLDSRGYPLLGQVAETITRGIETGNNRVFLVQEDEIKESGLKGDYFLPCFGGEEILPYLVLTPKQYLVLIPEGEEVEEEILTWLKERDDYFICQCKEGKLKNYIALKERYKVRKGIIPWYALNSPRLNLTSRSQLVLRQTSDRLIAAPNGKFKANLSNVQNILLRSGCGFDTFYLLSLLNSTLANFYYQHLVQERGRTFAEVKRQNLQRLPLYPAGREEQLKLNYLAQLIQGKREELANLFLIEPADCLKVTSFAAVKESYFKELKLNQDLLQNYHELKELTCQLEGERISLFARLKLRDKHNPKLFSPEQSEKEQEILRGRVENPLFRQMLISFWEGLKRFPAGYTKTLEEKINLLPTPLPSAENLAIFQRFFAGRQKLALLKEEIIRLERCVDRYVYHLYDLKENQIKLVEEFYWQEQFGFMQEKLPNLREAELYLQTLKKAGSKEKEVGA